MRYPVIASRGIVVFPKHQVTLEIGRRQSLNAIDLAVSNFQEKAILVSQRDVMKDQATTPEDLFNIGTLVSVKIERTNPNNTRTITVTGLERVRLSNFDFNDNQLIEADTEVLKTRTGDSKKEKDLVDAISKNLETAVSSLSNVPKNVLSTLAEGISADELVNMVANYLPLPLEKKQALLEIVETNSRLDQLHRFLQIETKSSDIDKAIDSNVRKTLDTQQKEFLLREKMKAIKEELGDINSKDTDVEKWKEAIKDKRFPDNVRTTVLDEIRKFEQTPQMAAEANVVRGYIEWIISLPWMTYSKESDSLSDAKKTLDKYHYGLKKVKERIIEHLAVKMNTKNTMAPILTLVGPPGVGKTSLAKSIAEAVGREFVKVALGGVRDEAEIRGHRRTYVGAMPGKIIQAIKRAKTSNPVILLDEIDKMSSDFRGDPTSAMLEVLDPEQNKTFQDHFLELEYDLSQVMFIATANFYDQIPAPLIDRVELIPLEQYTSEEKLEIAKTYIIPKVIKEHGLAKTQFKIADEVISYVIDKYTQEAGVRGLQRELSKLARKLVVKKLSDELKGAFTITKDAAKELLGKEQVYKEQLSEVSEVGLANGMYFSSVGGGVLPIEVTTYESEKGGTVLTGMIKDVMKESLNISVAYLRANAKKFGIDFPWDSKTIQVHVPAGATPKDGPSAGIAFTTAVVSALLGIAVPRSYALTGEITLRGKVLPIGGLREKTLGAVEAGINTIFYPHENERDLDDLANKVKQHAKLVAVKDFEEVFNYIFKTPAPSSSRIIKPRSTTPTSAHA